MDEGRQGRTGRLWGWIIVILIVILAVGGVLIHQHRKPAATPAPSSNNTSDNQDFNTPPVPGTENVRAQPLLDGPLARHLDSGPSATPGTISPTNMKTAYTIPTNPGGAGTIAIVDAYADPG